MNNFQFEKIELQIKSLKALSKAEKRVRLNHAYWSQRAVSGSIKHRKLKGTGMTHAQAPPLLKVTHERNSSEGPDGVNMMYGPLILIRFYKILTRRAMLRRIYYTRVA